VVAVRTEDRTWENETYTETTAELSDGERTYTFKHRHKSGDGFVPPAAFASLWVRVEYATTEKGKVSVRGKILL